MSAKQVAVLAVFLGGVANASGDSLETFSDFDTYGSTGSKYNPEPAIYLGETMVFDYDAATGDIRWWRDTTGTWSVIDGNGGSLGQISGDVGSAGISAIAFGNVLHVFYMQSTGDLRHSVFNGSAWFAETLDGAGGGGGKTSNTLGSKPNATVWSSKLWVSYIDTTDDDLRLANFDGTSWAFAVHDGAGGSDGRLTDSMNDPKMLADGSYLRIFYKSLDSNNHSTLRMAAWSGSGNWVFTTIDGESGMGTLEEIVAMPIAAVAYGGSTYVFYDSYNSSTFHNTLRRAKLTSGNWTYATVDGDSSSGGRTANNTSHVSAAVQNSKIHLYYYDIDDNNLRHAWGTGGGWAYETADGHTNDGAGRLDSNIGAYSATLDWAFPLVFYEDIANGSVRIAWGEYP